ncbi:MAG: LacI family DNA-binding transcriptional regulator [Victivallales bacterium]|nr:LacI family DNA-binding transcriptional regulator [Victivallales bacterium]
MNKSKAVNIRDIANEAGVSVASVSRALQPVASKKLAEKTRKHILEVCERMNYQPNELFRRMRRRRANTVAFIFPAQDTSVHGGYGHYMDFNMAASLSGAQEFMATHEIDILLLEATPAFIASRRYLKMIRGQLLDGVIVWGITYNADYVAEILGENIPVVMLQTEDEKYNCSKVVSDEYKAMGELVNRVVKAGHRHIAVLNSPQTSSGGVQRTNGVNAALQACSITPDYASDRSGYDYQFGYEEAERIITGASHITCIICPCNAVAFGCVAALEKHGKRIPDDISVAGAGGMNLPGITYKLDSFLYPSREIGRKGAEILLKHINGNLTPEKVVIPTIPFPGKTISNLTPQFKENQ